MLFGAIGQTATMVLLAVLGSVNSSSTQVASAVLLFVFNSFFVIGWLRMTWLYVGPTWTRDSEKLKRCLGVPEDDLPHLQGVQATEVGGGCG